MLAWLSIWTPERGADLHMAQLLPLPLTISCSSKIQIGFTFLVPAHQGSPGKGPLNVCVCIYIYTGIQYPTCTHCHSKTVCQAVSAGSWHDMPNARHEKQMTCVLCMACMLPVDDNDTCC